MHMAFYMNEDSGNFNGLSLSYTRGLFFSKNMTAGLETGAKLAWCHKADRSPRMTEKMDFLSLSLPVDFKYRFRLFNRNLGVAPFTGPNFRFNIIGRRRVSTDANHMYYKSINLLSDYVEYPANIFQFGWRAGLNFYHKRFFWGYAFTYDLNYYVSETKRDYGCCARGRGDDKQSYCRSRIFLLSNRPC